MVDIFNDLAVTREDALKEVGEWLANDHQRITKEKGLLFYLNMKDWESLKNFSLLSLSP